MDVVPNNFTNYKQSHAHARTKHCKISSEYKKKKPHLFPRIKSPKRTIKNRNFHELKGGKTEEITKNRKEKKKQGGRGELTFSGVCGGGGTWDSGGGGGG